MQVVFWVPSRAGMVRLAVHGWAPFAVFQRSITSEQHIGCGHALRHWKDKAAVDSGNPSPVRNHSRPAECLVFVPHAPTQWRRSGRQTRGIYWRSAKGGLNLKRGMSESLIDRAQIIVALRAAAKRLPFFISGTPLALNCRRNRRGLGLRPFCARERSAIATRPNRARPCHELARISPGSGAAA
jgi:hypothetical protein